MFENPKCFGKWDKLGCSDGSSIMLNSSHLYPLCEDEYVNGVKRLMLNQLESPLSLELRPTNHCNNHCGICYSKEYRKKQRVYLNLSRALDLIDEAKDLGIKVIRFCGGGEPLMWYGIEKVMEKVSKLGIGVVLISNGGLLNSYNSPIIVENSRYIRISLNGGIKSHHLFHGCSIDEFPRIINSLERISKIRISQNLDNKLYMAVTYILSPLNLSEVYPTAKLIKEIGFDAIYFRVPTLHIGFSPYYEKIFSEEYEKCDGLNSSDFFVHFAQRAINAKANPSINQSYCFQSQLRLYVEATGNISFCDKYSPTSENSLGNIYSNSLIQIWKNNRVRLEFKERDIVRCEGCGSAYFNRAMEFIKEKLIENSNVQFFRVFDNMTAQ
jgi:MoaA/NifB/PqqE/SkfB family radical SAM enzyme